MQRLFESFDTDVEKGFQETNEMSCSTKRTLLDNSVILVLITVSRMTGRNGQLHSTVHVPAMESIANLFHGFFKEG